MTSDLPLLSSTIDTSLRSSALSKPADINLAWWPVERGNELKGRCIPRSTCRLIFPPCTASASALVLIDTHHSRYDGSMAQGGLKKKSDKFSIASKSKAAKQSKPLGPKKGGRI